MIAMNNFTEQYQNLLKHLKLQYLYMDFPSYHSKNHLYSSSNPHHWSLLIFLKYFYKKLDHFNL